MGAREAVMGSAGRARRLRGIGSRPGGVALLAAVALGVAVLAAASPQIGAQVDPVGPEPGADAVRVAVRHLPPFVVVDDDRLSGFSIDIWDEIADRAEWTTEWVVVDNVGAQLDAVTSGRADAAIGAITVTAEREETVDFSQPIADGGLAVLTRVSDGAGWLDEAWIVAGMALRFITVLVVVLVVAGHIIWLAERRRNDAMPERYVPGVLEAMWFAVVTVFTVGYGDHVPRSPFGRVATVGFILVGVIAVSQFTALLATELTAHRLSGAVDGIDDVRDGQVATVAGTTGGEALERRDVEAVAVDDIDAAVDLLEDRRVDAVVFDEPVLVDRANRSGGGDLGVVGGIFEPGYYAIATLPRSPLMEAVDHGLLEAREDGSWDRIRRQWFDRPG
jgi:polar amino acid transport system substrate-binding protein